MLRLRRVSPVALALVLACGGPTPAPQQPEAKEPDASAAAAPAPAPAPVARADAGTSTAQAADPPLPQAGPPVVTLLDPGAEPRKPLRYAFQKKPETVQMDMKMAMAMSAGGKASPTMQMPTIRVTMDLKPVSVEPDGTVTATVETKKAEVLKDAPLPKELQDKLQKDLLGMVGIKGKTVVTSRGFAKEASIQAPPDAPPQVKQILDSMKDSLRDMSMPLPEEPIGKNAKWEVKTVLVSQLTTTQKATYTAKEIGDKSATLDATVVQTAPPQKVTTPPNMPPEATLHLDSHTGQGSGTVKLALDRMTPTSNMKLDAKTMMTVKLGDETQPIGTDLSMQMTIKPAGK